MRGLVLISGGIDSPVAAYVMADNDLAAVHFDTSPYSDTVATAEKVVEKLKEILKREIPFSIVPHGGILSEFLHICGEENRKYTCIFCKRMMFRMAERIAHRETCHFLITGENLGQVASQTLKNIYVTSRAVEIPIVRPLIGLDKLDIISIAEKISTYDISVEKASECSAVPKYPAVRGHLEKIEALEKSLDIQSHTQKALEAAEKRI